MKNYLKRMIEPPAILHKKLFRLPKKWNRNQGMIGSEVGRKIGHTVFCEPYKEFLSDRAETFINYFSLFGVSLVIAPPCKSEY